MMHDVGGDVRTTEIMLRVFGYYICTIYSMHMYSTIQHDNKPESNVEPNKNQPDVKIGKGLGVYIQQ